MIDHHRRCIAVLVTLERLLFDGRTFGVVGPASHKLPEGTSDWTITGKVLFASVPAKEWKKREQSRGPKSGVSCTSGQNAARSTKNEFLCKMRRAAQKMSSCPNENSFLLVKASTKIQF